MTLNLGNQDLNNPAIVAIRAEYQAKLMRDAAQAFPTLPPNEAKKAWLGRLLAQSLHQSSRIDIIRLKSFFPFLPFALVRTFSDDTSVDFLGKKNPFKWRLIVDYDSDPLSAARTAENRKFEQMLKKVQLIYIALVLAATVTFIYFLNKKSNLLA